MKVSTQEQIYFVSNLVTRKSYIKIGEKVIHTDASPYVNTHYFKFIRKINPLLAYRFRFDTYLFNEKLDVTVILDKENFFRIYELEGMDNFFLKGKWIGYNQDGDEGGTTTWLDKDLTCLEVEKLFSIKLTAE